MKISSLLFSLVFIFGGIAHAEKHLETPSDPVHDEKGQTEQKIIHQMSPDLYMQSPFGNSGRALSSRAPAAGSTAANTNPIVYRGGPVMSQVSQVVLIWYGSWNQNNNTDTPAGQQIIRDAIWGMSQANSVNNYSGITTGYQSTLGKYTDGTGAAVSAASSASIKEYSQAANTKYGNKTLTDASVWALVKNFAGNGDPNAIYLVLSSSDIAESSGFLTKYCGWHTYGSIGSNKIKYGFIGNPNKNLAACAVQSVSPNGNPAVDGMVSIIAHELVETVSDPLLNAWYNASGYENSDMCAWTFGSKLSQAPNGSYWNVSLPTASGSNRPYLLQRQLGVADSKCYINANGSIQ